MACEIPGHGHCQELFGKLSEYIDGELDPSARRRIEEHIDNCLACFACLQTLRQTVALCGKIGDRPLPDSLSERMNTLLNDVPKAPPP
jgi:anti-sigma factor RsiW